MNIIKTITTLLFFVSFTFATQAQISQINSTSETSTNDLEQELSNTDQENYNNTATFLPAESNITDTKTSNTNTLIIDTNTYAFSFNHKQFLKPVFKKSAYC